MLKSFKEWVELKEIASSGGGLGGGGGSNSGFYGNQSSMFRKQRFSAAAPFSKQGPVKSAIGTVAGAMGQETQDAVGFVPTTPLMPGGDESLLKRLKEKPDSHILAFPAGPEIPYIGIIDTDTNTVVDHTTQYVPMIQIAGDRDRQEPLTIDAIHQKLESIRNQMGVGTLAQGQEDPAATNPEFIRWLDQSIGTTMKTYIDSEVAKGQKAGAAPMNVSSPEGPFWDGQKAVYTITVTPEKGGTQTPGY